MVSHILQLVSQYGYAGLFAALVLGIVGLPIPDETILVFCGYLVSQGTMKPAAAYFAGAAGAICGISTSYVVGRTAGLVLVQRYGRYARITPVSLARVQTWFERRGEWVLTVGYFILGVRHVTALVAGVSRLSYRRFAAFAYAGALLWVGVFLSVGYYVGARWQSVLPLVHRYSLAMIGIVLVAGVCWWLWARARARVI